MRLLRFFNNDLSRIRQRDTAKMYYDFTSFSCTPYTATLSKYWKKANEKRRKHNKAGWNTSNLAESRQEEVQFMLFAINFRLVVTTNKLPRGILIKKIITNKSLSGCRSFTRCQSFLCWVMNFKINKSSGFKWLRDNKFLGNYGKLHLGPDAKDYLEKYF